MKERYFLALAIVTLFAAAVRAEDLGGEVYEVADSGPWCRVIGGAEMLVLRPYLNNGEAFVVGDAAGNVRVRNFEFDYALSPRLWLGVENCEGFGARIRYFYLNQDANQETAIVDLGLNDFAGRTISENDAAFQASADIAGVLDEVMMVNTGLELQTLDIEATQRFDLCPASFSIAAGIRWARTESTLAVTTLDAFNVVDEEYFVAADFEGVGPTVALALDRPLWRGLSFVAGARGSVMLGESDVNVLAAQNFAMNDRKTGMFIGEARLGLEYAYQLAGGSEVFVRGTWEGQYWSGMPLSTRMGPNFSDSDELFLDGFSLALGVTY